MCSFTLQFNSVYFPVTLKPIIVLQICYTGSIPVLPKSFLTAAIWKLKLYQSVISNSKNPPANLPPSWEQARGQAWVRLGSQLLLCCTCLLYGWAICPEQWVSQKQQHGYVAPFNAIFIHPFYMPTDLECFYKWPLLHMPSTEVTRKTNWMRHCELNCVLPTN